MNILFAFADDWGRYASIYDDNAINPLIHTPNFDRIATEGMLFRNAYVPAPSCTPCRSSLLSGRYFWNTGLGAILTGAVWDDNIQTYPLILEQAGYFIGHTYKVWAPGKSYNAPYGGKRTAYESAGKEFNQFSHYVSARSADIGIQSAKQELLDEVRGNFKSFLRAKPDNQPFCYWWGPTNTHRTWEQGSGKSLWNMNPDDLKGKMPDFLPDVHEVREDFCDYLGECQAVDAGLGVLIECLEQAGELDNTLIVVSGDHGIPGIPRAKCNLYQLGCEVALAMRWPETIQPGRIADDFVNLMDLAPTFLDAAGVAVPDIMEGHSLLNIMRSEVSGQIEDHRQYIIAGRERHVDTARDGNLPYPQRAIHTADYLYIINFEPDRWPMGDPKGLDDLNAIAPMYTTLQWHTRTVYQDLDASPTKAWLIHHRDEENVRALYQLAFGKRPFSELYDLKSDPHYMNNVANDPAYKQIQRTLHQQLMDELINHGDPRVIETPCRFENSPYAGSLQDFQIE